MSINNTKTIRVLSIFGTRPEAIKMAPLVKALESDMRFDSVVCVTGQHREMLDQVLEIFNIQPNYDLKIMRPQQSLAQITSRILLGLAPVLEAVRPDWVFVHGDTATTAAASLAAYYAQTPLAHIEAGLRTHDIYAPWPEEVNRKVAGVIAACHFAPTPMAKENLLREGIAEHNIVVTGNTVIDALFMMTVQLQTSAPLRYLIDQELSFLNKEKKLILVTGHRRENFGVGLENICHALKQLAQRPDVQIIYPVHLNPNVKAVVEKSLAGCDNIKLIKPLDYLPFIRLLSQAHIVITDSGGIQEEAPSLGVPVLVTRETTERPEALESGGVKLVGTNKDKIIRETNDLLDHKDKYKKMSKAINPYGDGKAAQRIISHIAAHPTSFITN